MNPRARAGWIAWYAALLAVLAAGIVLATEHLARPWVVAGGSMEPTLVAGDRVLVDVWTYRHREPRPGEVLLFRTSGSGRPVLVKRVAPPPAGSTQERGLWVLGDNAQDSVDSREFGAVPTSSVVGRVVWRFWPLSRAGAVRSESR